MNRLSKENYLLQVKNAMLFHFSHKEINITLEDINLIFISGKETGKTEEDVYDELGLPKDFVRSLLQDKGHDRFKSNLIGNILIGFIICAITILILQHPNPILNCIPALIIPVFIWYTLGGNCLYRINLESKKYLKYNFLFYIFSFLIVFSQQLLEVLLKANNDLMISLTLSIYYVSKLAIMLAVILLAIIAIRLYKGHYFLFGIFLLLHGMIFSSQLYIDHLNRLEKIDAPFTICSLPYCMNFIISLFNYFQIRRKKVNS